MLDFIGSGYKLIIISVCASLFVLSGLLLYRFVYPKKNINFFTLLLLLSLLPIISIFRPGLYESGDFNIHIYRSMEFYKSLTEGHVMPSWAGDLNATYGYPLFIFNYTLPYYFVCLLHFLGFSFVLSMKLFLSINFLFSAIFMYFASKKLFKNEAGAFVSTIFYQFAPYHLVDLNFKVAFGEIMVFTMLPIVFLLLQKLWEKRNILFLALSSLSGALLIMSHSITAFLIIDLFVVYGAFLSIAKRDKFFFFSTILAFVLSSLSSLYLWLGPFYMNQYTITTKMNVAKNSLGMDIWEMLYSPWRFGLLFQGPKGEINTPLGYAHIFIVVVLVAFLYKKKSISKNKYHLFFWLGTFFAVAFLASIYSSFLWSQIKIPILLTLPERMPILIVFILSILAGFFALNFLKKKILLWIIVGFTIFSTILNWGHRRVISTMGEQNLIESLPKSTMDVEAHWYANSKWRDVSDPWYRYIPDRHIEIMKGKGELKDLERKTTLHSYVVLALTNLEIRENTLYFPGWQTSVDERLVVTKPDKDGVITFSVPKGLHFVKVEYKDIPLYKYSKIVSSIFLLILILASCQSFLKRKKQY